MMGESAAATHGQNDRDIRLNARYLGLRQAEAVGRDRECRDQILRAPEGKRNIGCQAHYVSSLAAHNGHPWQPPERA